MISSEVQRTLVKSPPELWAELSDPAALARHLGVLGEIRITRAEPEKRVEWEAETASGTVLIKPSGWGTKVTLSVSRDLALANTEPALAAEMEAEETIAPETPVVEQIAAEQALEPVDSSDELCQTPEPKTTPEAEAAPELDASSEPEPVLSEQTLAETEQVSPAPDAPPENLEPAPEPRRGFFARIFGRRRPKDLSTGTDETTSENAPSAFAEDSPSEEPSTPSEPVLTISAIESLQARFQSTPPATAEVAEIPLPVAAGTEETESAPSTDPPSADSSEAEVERSTDVNPEQVVDVAAELHAAEEAAVGEVTALLTGVLDRLGAAHHRPFSRS